MVGEGCRRLSFREYTCFSWRWNSSLLAVEVDDVLHV